ncbi:MAG: adenylyl-sulfate kinase [Acidimicrobiia bacterium]|nr:adenylyl-sulfate kinase [Acidimicrobiia bacterium]
MTPPARVPKSTNITWSEGHVTPDRRREILGHGPATIWFTGLSGSGKSTVATQVESILAGRGVNAFVLDGDNVRHGLNSDLGFAPADRAENIRRVGEVCRLFHDAGMIVLTAFISPYRTDRDVVRARHPAGTFFEVFVEAPLDVCEARDVKGLYAKARAGEIPDFSGVSAPYEPPVGAELTLDTDAQTVEESAAAVLTLLEEQGILG